MQSIANNIQSTIKKLQLRREGSMLTGVSGGVAEYFGVDVTLVRLGAVAMAFVSAWTIPAYIAAAFILPAEEANDTSSAPKPLFDGQRLVKQVKESSKELLEAASQYDRVAFCQRWNLQIRSICRAWGEALNE